MKVLLTGHKGYLGSHVEALLKESGHEVHGIDAGWFSYPHSTKGKLVRHIFPMDVEEADVVIHLAWFSSAGDKLANLQEQSLEETDYLVSLCVQTETRLIFASTASVYGFRPDSPPLRECNEPKPVCPYGRWKLTAEDHIRQMMAPGTYLIFRKGTLMGEGYRDNRTRLDLAVNAFIASAITEGVIHVWDPETCRPMLHVKDAAEAYLRAVEGWHNADTPINLGHKNYQILALAHWVASLMETEPEVEVDFRVSDGSARSYKLNCDLARELGYEMDRGIQEVVWGFEQGCPDLEAATQKNVQWMSFLLEMHKWVQDIPIPEVEDGCS